MDKKTTSEKEAAFKALEKANNIELAEIAKHTLGYNPFLIDRQKLILPSVTRARTLAIFKEKIQSGKMDFAKNE